MSEPRTLRPRADAITDGVMNHRPTDCQWRPSEIYPGHDACLINGVAHYREREAATPLLDVQTAIANIVQQNIGRMDPDADPRMRDADEVVLYTRAGEFRALMRYARLAQQDGTGE